MDRHNIVLRAFLCSVLWASCHSLTTIITNGTYNLETTLQVNDTIEYVVLYDKSQSSLPSRITVHSENSDISHPLIVVVRQQREVLSWQLPLVVDSDSGGTTFVKAARTLCPQSVALLLRGQYLNETPIVTIATASTRNVSVVLDVRPEADFYVEESVAYNVTISPSEPKYYFFEFPAHRNYVVLEVDSSSDVCMTVSIQNVSCPVYDLNHDITFEGLWQTVQRKGGITITKEKFPHGYFIVFVAKGDDSDCTGDTYTNPNRTKTVTFVIKPSITYDDYIVAMSLTLVLIVMFSIIFGVTTCLCTRKGFRPRSMDFVQDDFYPTAITPSTIASPTDFVDDNISMDETEYDTIAEADTDRELLFGKTVVYLSDLARKDPRILKRKSYLYLWHVLTVALFYGLPVVQLVIAYQRELNDTGNQDLCYYNFLCAHPLGFLSDFNHLFSNVGYVLLGVLFVLLTRRREKLHHDVLFERHFGIPQHYGLFYAMGVALIMEGVLSGSYHVCPNHSNFQFDSSFMYITAVLCMVKIYQTRHPDINATAYSTFGVLAAVIALGMFGILEGSIYFWIVFTVIHLSTCIVLTAQIYYMGFWTFDRAVVGRIVRGTVSLQSFKPFYTGRMVLLLIGNVCNWILAVVGIINHEKDFATYLLSIFMSNLLLYFIFYIVMKLCHKERINLQALMFLVLAFGTAGAAYYFFVNKSISWALTPAQSRHYNRACNELLRFYDNHDIWHFLSAAAMFFSFMVLLTLDDDLSHTSRTKINVF